MTRKYVLFTLFFAIVALGIPFVVSATPVPIADSILSDEGWTIDNFDLTTGGARTIGAHTDGRFNHISLGEESSADCYQVKVTSYMKDTDDDGIGDTLTPTSPGYTEVISYSKFSAKGNRTYRLSMLVNTALVKENCEVSVGFSFTNSAGQKLCHTTSGLPVDTNGEWQRFTFDFTAPGTDCNAKFYLLYSDAAYDLENDYDKRNLCYISDLRVTELNAKTLTPLEPGEGMTFGGSSGKFDMSIKSITQSGNILTVITDGASYAFDKSKNTVTGTQLINEKRKVVTLSLDKPLTNLSVHSRSDNEAILTTGDDGVSFGVQMDGLMLISNHGDTDLNITCTSEIGGEFNRLAYGHLLAMDGVGGFTVNPAIPQGTGRLPRYETVGTLDFDGKYRDTSFISSEEKGWQIKWTISSGELLGASVFPPREYDWESFFNSRAPLINAGCWIDIYKYMSGQYTDLNGLSPDYEVTDAILWDFTHRGYGMSNSSQATPKDEENYKLHIDTAKEYGIKPLNYISFYFWHNRDVDEYITEVKRHRDTYGIEGIYSDGLPSYEWLASYEAMRRMRELFPDGTITVHATGISENGGPPLSSPDFFIPAIETYADSLVKCEDVPYTGTYWPYLKYGTAGFNTSGARITTKGNKWKNDAGNAISAIDQNMISLITGSSPRLRWNGKDLHLEETEVLDVIEKFHEINGNTDNYFKNSYQPLVRRLIRDYLEVNEVRTVINEDFSSVDKWSRHTDTDTSVVVYNNRLVLVDSGEGRCSAAYSFDKEESQVELNFNIQSNASGVGYANLNGGDDNAVSVMIFNGKLYYLESYGGYEEICQVSTEASTPVKIMADATSGRYDIYVNDVKMVSDKPFNDNLHFVDSVTFATDYNTVGRIYIDSLIMEAKF